MSVRRLENLRMTEKENKELIHKLYIEISAVLPKNIHFLLAIFDMETEVNTFTSSCCPVCAADLLTHSIESNNIQHDTHDELKVH